MAKKSVYAALEIADREVRLVVMELFNDRCNILRVERADHEGLRHSRIVNEDSVVRAIDQAVSQAQNALGYRIERVLLAIPSQDVRTSNQKVHIEIEDGTHTIRKFHIQQGLKSAREAAARQGYELVNLNHTDFYIDGVKTDKIPLGMDTSSFDMEVDLLYAARDIVYSYVMAVEKAGLQILDIFIDTYAAAKETGALVQSEDEPVILVDLEADHTALALLNQNRLAFTAVVDRGYSHFIRKLAEDHSLTDQAAWRLLENLFQEREMDAADTVIYIEQQEDDRVEISEKQLAEAVLPQIRSWIADINAASAPILASRKARYLLTGQGSSIPALKKMQKAFNAPASVYSVTEIGARNGAFTVPIGEAYAWDDVSRYGGSDKTSVNNNELEASIESITRYAKDQEGGFTRKLKKVMLTSKE